MRVLSLLFLALGVAPLAAKELYVGQKRPDTEAAIGCRSLSDARRSYSLYNTDPETQARFEREHCQYIDGGFFVESIDKSDIPPMVCMRPKGKAYCYWMVALSYMDIP